MVRASGCLHNCAGTDALAVIGTNQGNSTITINATGPVTLTGGAGPTSTFGPIAAIGSAGGFAANVTITSGGTVSVAGLVEQIVSWLGESDPTPPEEKWIAEQIARELQPLE